VSWIDVDQDARGLRPAGPFGWPRAWTAREVSAADWTTAVPAQALRELEEVVRRLRRQQLPVLMLAPRMFELDACRAMMARVRERLDHGIGVALLDRLPVEDWSEEEARAACWLLGQLLSQPVAQEWNGLMFRDILDRGGDQEYGNERAVTSRVLTFHTDNSGNRARPDYVGLMCLGKALEGGESRYCSLYSVYDALAGEAPVLLERLFQPLLHDRQGIHAPGEAPVLRAPALSFDGERLHGRFSLNKITEGYRKAGVEMDPRARDALDAVVAAIDACGLACTFSIERGQVQYLNNLEGLHHRADYVDGVQPQQRRHMLRTWYRNHGLPFFDG
jgi:HAMP domain-containing protein